MSQAPLTFARSHDATREACRLGCVVSQQHRPLEERVDSYDQQAVFSRTQTMATRFGLTKWELTAHFAHHLGVKPPMVRAFFAELERLAAYELKRTGEFMVPGIAKVVGPASVGADGPASVDGGVDQVSGEDDGPQGAGGRAAQRRGPVGGRFLVRRGNHEPDRNNCRRSSSSEGAGRRDGPKTRGKHWVGRGLRCPRRPSNQCGDVGAVSSEKARHIVVCGASDFVLKTLLTRGRFVAKTPECLA